MALAALPPQVLAIDLGTSSLKASLVGPDGRLTGWASRPMPLRLLPGGGAEQDPEDWWRALGDVVADLGRSHPEHVAAVRTICTSAQGEGTIAVGADGDTLTPCILWLDMRGKPHLDHQFGGFPSYRGVALKRIPRWLRLTGGMPSATGKDPAAHMLLIRETMPETYARTAYFLGVPDWIGWRLTGVVATPADSILTSWVTDNRDPHAIRYDGALVAASGIEARMLPPIVAGTEVLGRLTPRAAAFLGLSDRVQVVAGGMDTSMAAVGAGTTRLGEPALYLGTSSWITAHVARKKTDVLAGIASVPCAIPGRYLMTALQATAGANVAWVRDQLALPSGESEEFAELERIVAAEAAGAGGVLYAPWVSGERVPVDDPALRGAFVGLSLGTTRGQLIRAVYEGVAYNTAWMAGAVDRFLRSRPAQLRVCGGGAASDTWCQIFADVLDREVVRVDHPVAVNARGAGFVGAVGAGDLSFDDVPGLVTTERTFVPDPRHRDVYDAGKAAYDGLAKRLRPVYRRGYGAAAGIAQR